MRRARSVMIAATRLPNTSATPVPGGACTANAPPSGWAMASLTANCSLRTKAPSDGQRPAGMRSGRHPSRTTSGSHRTSTRPASTVSPSTPEGSGAASSQDSTTANGSVRRDTSTEPRCPAPPMSAESSDPPISPGPPRCSGTAGNGAVRSRRSPFGPWRPAVSPRPVASRSPVPWYPATRSASIHSPPPMTAAQLPKTAELTLRPVARQTSRVTKFRTSRSSMPCTREAAVERVALGAALSGRARHRVPQGHPRDPKDPRRPVYSSSLLSEVTMRTVWRCPAAGPSGSRPVPSTDSGLVLSATATSTTSARPELDRRDGRVSS